MMVLHKTTKKQNYGIISFQNYGKFDTWQVQTELNQSNMFSSSTDKDPSAH